MWQNKLIKAEFARMDFKKYMSNELSLCNNTHKIKLHIDENVPRVSQEPKSVFPLVPMVQYSFTQCPW